MATYIKQKRHDKEVHPLRIPNTFVEQSISFADAKQAILKALCGCKLGVASPSSKISADYLLQLLYHGNVLLVLLLPLDRGRSQRLLGCLGVLLGRGGRPVAVRRPGLVRVD